MREGGAPAAGWRWLLSKQRVLRRACPALPTAASSCQLPPLCRLMDYALENDLPHWRVDGSRQRVGVPPPMHPVPRDAQRCCPGSGARRRASDPSLQPGCAYQIAEYARCSKNEQVHRAPGPSAGRLLLEQRADQLQGHGRQ